MSMHRIKKYLKNCFVPFRDFRDTFLLSRILAKYAKERLKCIHHKKAYFSVESDLAYLDSCVKLANKFHIRG